MKTFLWWANGVAMLPIAAAAIIQPIEIQAEPCDVPVCDPHGYIAIFTTVPAAGVALLALVGLLVLSSGYRAGFGIALGAAATCGGLLALLWPGLSGEVRWPIAALAVVVAGLAIAGLRLPPGPLRPSPAGPPQPLYPPPDSE